MRAIVILLALLASSRQCPTLPPVQPGDVIVFPGWQGKRVVAEIWEVKGRRALIRSATREPNVLPVWIELDQLDWLIILSRRSDPH